VKLNNTIPDLSTMKFGDLWTIKTTSSPPRVTIGDGHQSVPVLQVGIRTSCTQWQDYSTTDPSLDLAGLPADAVICVICMGEGSWEIMRELPKWSPVPDADPGLVGKAKAFFGFGRS